MHIRRAEIQRQTAETKIAVEWSLDGRGESNIATGLPFFDHMLTLFARHSLTNLVVAAEGDLEVDSHHTIEDTGIVLGQALTQAVGDKTGLVRYGSFLLPMDETLCRVALDLSGRPFLEYHLPESLQYQRFDRIGGHFPLQYVEEFLRAFCSTGGLTMHVDVLRSRDLHHAAEAVFKGVARALDAALRRDPRVLGVPSTKGVLV